MARLLRALGGPPFRWVPMESSLPPQSNGAVIANPDEVGMWQSRLKLPRLPTPWGIVLTLQVLVAHRLRWGCTNSLQYYYKILP
ncbi:MAG: hypothetical protein V3S17_06690, partial [candidate division Zixibacteria bacterium]